MEAHLLLSHLHWDHIQGLPFFTPLYIPSTRLTLVGAKPPEDSLREELARQMRAPHFPVGWDQLPSLLSTREIRPGQGITLEGVSIRTARLNHPGGVVAYRIDYGGRSVVYATDTEHYACIDPTLLQLAKGADVLIYDSMYTEAEYAGTAGPSKVGWGHSTWQAGVAVAKAAGVGTFVLFHHDPSRDDAAVAALEAQAQAAFPEGEVLAAREGVCIELEAEPRAQVA